MFEKIKAFFALSADAVTARNDAVYATLGYGAQEIPTDHATIGARIEDARARNERARAKLPKL